MDELLKMLWEDYSRLNPQALKIHKLLEGRGEVIKNDHIAFRTFDHPAVGIARFEKIFLDLGYQAKGDYHFKQKKLYAKHYEHEDSNQPKIFISELLMGEFSEGLQTTLGPLIERVDSSLTDNRHFCVSGRPWPLLYSTYEKLLAESEYAGWMSAFGFRVNHFTVNVNKLKTFDGLSALNQFLKSEGFELNQSGGEIKGGPDVHLEQSSTMAARIPVDFDNGQFEIPSCYYEFAKRYPLADGSLYQGFVEASADKIFESTDSHPLKTKEDIVKNWLPRYTDTPLKSFGKYILLTNFSNYVERFAKMNKVRVRGRGKPMQVATADDISIINFGMGSAMAATIMDLLSAIKPKAVLLLGKCGGLKREMKVGDLILPIAAIRGEGTGEWYLPAEVPSLPSFRLQMAVSSTIRKCKQDYRTGVVYTTNRRVWEHDREFKEYLEEIRAMGIDMETATVFTVGFINQIPRGALLLVSDNPMVPEGVKTSTSDKIVTRKFVDLHLQIGIDSLAELRDSGESVKHLRFHRSQSSA